MKKVWKWLLGILLGLVVVGLLIGAGFLMRTYMHPFAVQSRGFQVLTDGNQEVLQFSGNSQGFGPGMMHTRIFDQNGGQGVLQVEGSARAVNAGFGVGRGICGPARFGGLLGGLLGLGLLTLMVLAIIWMIRGLRKPKVVVPAVPAEATPAVVTTPCKKCGEPVQAGWKVCPNCGKKI